MAEKSKPPLPQVVGDSPLVLKNKEFKIFGRD
jgi:hypothetical protein